MRTRNQLRIVAGQLGGRRVRFPNAPGLRPTAERVRETLFNWLQGELQGRHCLDMFAGSGALGIEALSRGAEHVTFVERSKPVVRQLQDNLAVLGVGERSTLVNADALQWLARATGTFDLVFLDPPFAAGALGRACQLLLEQALLSPGAWVYLERDSKQPWPALPEPWQEHRKGTAGQAAFRLMRHLG